MGQALAARFPGADDLVADHDEGLVTLDLDAIARRGLTRAAVEKVIEEALLSTGVVERVYTHARLLGEPPADDPRVCPLPGLLLRAAQPPRDPALKPFVYVDDEYSGGTGHGTVHDYDRHVPVVFMGQRHPPGPPGRGVRPRGHRPHPRAPARPRLPARDRPAHPGRGPGRSEGRICRLRKRLDHEHDSPGHQDEAHDGAGRRLLERLLRPERARGSRAERGHGRHLQPRHRRDRGEGRPARPGCPSSTGSSPRIRRRARRRSPGS